MWYAPLVIKKATLNRGNRNMAEHISRKATARRLVCVTEKATERTGRRG